MSRSVRDGIGRTSFRTGHEGGPGTSRGHSRPPPSVPRHANRRPCRHPTTRSDLADAMRSRIVGYFADGLRVL
jgi:hypothetical protein